MSYFQSIFGPNYTSLLKYTSKSNNFSKNPLGASYCNFFYQKIVSVKNKNDSVKSLQKGRANEILTYKGGAVRIQIKMGN